MKINTNQKLKTLDGKQELKTQSGEATTLSDVICNSLLAHGNGDSMKCYALAQKINEADELDVDAGDVDLIKTAIKTGQTPYTNLAKGQALVMLQE